MIKFKQTEIGEMPEEWRAVSLGEITTELIGGGTPKTDMLDYWDGPIEWMTSAYMLAREVNTGQRTITKKGLDASATHLVPKNNLLVATRVGIGKLAINRVDIAISQDITGVVLNNSLADTDFIYWAILASKNKLKSLAQGSTIKGVLRTDLAKLSLLLPPLSEQRKIAEVLTTVDEAIQKVDKAISKTGRVKQGLMDKLLTRGIGHTKFKQTEIGEMPEEWEVVELGNSQHFELIMGQSPPSESYNRDQDGLPFMQGNAEFGALFPQPLKHTNQPLKIAEKDDILISVRAPVGELNLCPYKICMGRGLGAIHVKDSDYWFYFYYLQSIKEKIQSKSSGSTFKAITGSELGKIKTPLPSLPEQRKIAEMLTMIDQKLELQRKRKDKLERVKHGLMDELLTGKKRLVG